MKNVKVKVLRTVHHGALYLTKGSTTEIPEAWATAWTKGPKPAVELIKEK